MLLSQIVFNIKNLVAGGLQSDDESLSDEQLIFIFDYYRSKWIHQEYNKRGYGAIVSLEQNLFRVKVNDLDETKALGSGLAIANARMTVEIPRLVMLADNTALSYVGSVDGTNPYQRVSRNRMPLIQHARYTYNEGFYYEFGNRIVIRFAGEEPSDLVAISGVFERPQVVMQFVLDAENAESDPNGTDVLDLDFHFEYPASANSIDSILKMITDSEIKLTKVIPSDSVNDTTDKQIVNA